MVIRLKSPVDFEPRQISSSLIFVSLLVYFFVCVCSIAAVTLAGRLPFAANVLHCD